MTNPQIGPPPACTATTITIDANRPKRPAIAKGMRSSFGLLCQLGMNVLVNLLRHFSSGCPCEGRVWTAVSLMRADSACQGALAPV
jgi:hypothetical protein